jgi:hypothetical protein
VIAIRRAAFITAAVGLLLLVGCARSPAPEDVAVEYGRAIYRYDAAAIYRLASAADRRAKDEETVRAQVGGPTGFALEIIQHLALFMNAKPVATRLLGNRATVSLKLTLPDANAPDIRMLARDWDETALDALADSERAKVLRTLDELHERRTLPVVEGQETFELVKEGGGWRLVLDWGGAILVRFSASTAKTPALDVTTTPAEIRAKPGESFRVTLRATNVSGHEITSRVGHRIAPEADASFLALLQCPLFLPATFKPGETREFVSEYLLLKDTPGRVTAFRVTYEFADDRR